MRIHIAAALTTVLCVPAAALEPEVRGLLFPKRVDAFSEGHDKSSTEYQKTSWEEPNKAESTKLPDAGISLKLSTGNERQRKGTYRNQLELG